jgi:hypothetical protein
VTDPLRRIDELLLKRATSGLTRAEEAELERLLEAHPGLDTEAYELGAAAVLLAALDLGDPLPQRLRAKIEQSATELFAHRTGGGR